MFEIGIVGAKNSGKTTLIEALVRMLTMRGYRVGTVKHTAHDHTFDTESKDSFRHRAAGAAMTLAVSAGELALFCSGTQLLDEIISRFVKSHCEFCLVEGDRAANRPKVLLTRVLNWQQNAKMSNIIASYGPKALSPDIPHFGFESVNELADALIAGMLVRRRSCRS